MEYSRLIQNIKYRSDIDGLRAVAVLSVVLFHSGIAGFSGGYVGVDVFFVISGFLITSIIESEISAGLFSIVSFYERRFRRIVPALLVVTIFVVLSCLFLFMPYDLRVAGDTVLSSSLFSSNIFLYLKSGYFDNSSHINPLLHTWSLAVEEQFYIAFPVILFFLHKFMKKEFVSWVLFFIVFLSLCFSIYEVDVNRSAAFYLIFSRAWELLVGSILALRLLPPLKNRALLQAISFSGLALIVGSVSLYTEGTLFPGLSAVAPVIGAVMIIYAGSNGKTATSSLLGFGPLVFVGLISYSLYLWHWPVLVFFRYFSMRDPTWDEGLALSTLSFCLAVVSWRYIERPFRDKTRLTRRIVFLVAGSYVCLGIGVGAVLHLTKGLPGRLPADVAAIGMVAMDHNPSREACDSRAPERIDRDDVCAIGAENVPADFVAIGDSFGDAIAPGINASARELGHGGYVLTRGGCGPLAGVNQDYGRPGPCRDFVAAALRFVDRHPEIRSVILVGRWTAFSEGTRFGVNKNKDMFITDDQSVVAGYDENRRVFERGLMRTLDALSGKSVYIAAYIPEQRVNVPQAMALQRYLGRAETVSVDRQSFDLRQKYVHVVMDDLSKKYAFQIIDVGATICDLSECVSHVDGLPIYHDDNHFSNQGAIYLRALFDVVFLGPVAPKL